MSQNEMISKLKTKENDIMNMIDRLGYKNEYITIEDRTIKSNKMFNEIKSNFNLGFLGYYSKDLHNMFDKSTKYSLYKYMPSSVLEYYYTFLIHLEEYISDQGSLDLYDEKVGIKRYAQLKGEHYKKVYKDEYKKTPFTDVKQLNSNEYLIGILTEKLDLFSKYDESFIRFKVNELSNTRSSISIVHLLHFSHKSVIVSFLLFSFKRLDVILSNADCSGITDITKEYFRSFVLIIFTVKSFLYIFFKVTSSFLMASCFFIPFLYPFFYWTICPPQIFVNKLSNIHFYFLFIL